MSQPNTHQRPDEGEPKKGNARASKGGFMNALRAGRLARLLGAAPLVAPTAAAVTGAAIVGAPSAAEAQTVPGLTVPDEEAPSSPRPGRTPPSPGSTKTPKIEELEKKVGELEGTVKILKKEVCTKYGLPLDCSDDVLRAEIEKGDKPLTASETAWYILSLLYKLLPAAAVVWLIYERKKSSEMQLIKRLLEALGITEGMSVRAIRKNVMDAIDEYFRREPGERGGGEEGEGEGEEDDDR